jgi:hypothetical protein
MGVRESSGIDPGVRTRLPSGTSILSTIAGAVLGPVAAVGLGVVGGFRARRLAVVELVVAMWRRGRGHSWWRTADGETAADVEAGGAVGRAHADARSVHAAVAMAMVVCCFIANTVRRCR